MNKYLSRCWICNDGFIDGVDGTCDEQTCICDKCNNESSIETVYGLTSTENIDSGELELHRGYIT